MSESELEHSIKELVKKLRKEDKPTLADVINESWDKPVHEYAQGLFEYRAGSPMEPALLESFREELIETGYDAHTIEQALEDIATYRTIQTAHHTEIAPPNRMFCIDWMCTRGLAPARPYLIGAFSGVPFSNKSKPGRITINGETINFIPKTHQDALVYETKILEKTCETFRKLPAEVAWYMDEPQLDEYFTHWAGRSESKLLSNVLDHPVLVFDINRVVARYLIKVLPDENHLLHKILLDPKTTEKTLGLFGRNVHFFYSPYETTKYSKQENLYYLDGYGFAGDHERVPNTLEEMITALRDNKLCPGTLLVFTALSFLNDFQCLGSFVQVEYLTRFKELWQSSGLLTRDITNVPTASLTTGMFPTNPEFAVLDISTQHAVIPGKPTDLLGNYYLPIWKHNLYYTNKQTGMSLRPGKVHLIGIAGKGMSGLAIMLHDAGWTVTGSDVGSFGAPVEALQKSGIQFSDEYSADNISDDLDLIVIGKHAKLTKENEEVAAALNAKAPVKSFAEVVGALTRDRVNIVVAGSYAKSTCTSLIAWCLRENDLDPGYFIGASPVGFEKTAYLGTGDYFVAEGDEYPTSNFDDRAKFLFLHPDHVLLTSGEHDHVTVFPTVEDYLKPYQQLMSEMSERGSVTGCIDNPNVSDLLGATNAKQNTYSLGNITTWHAKNISAGNFELWHGDQKVTDMTTQLIGDYNVQNIVGVAALLIENEILTAKQVAKAVATFGGVRGRLDCKNPGGKIPVYESYGSSYTKAKSSIEAILKHFPGKQLRIIFEPHTFTWRDPSQSDAYRDVFTGAASVILYKTPTSHGKNVEGQLSLDDIQNLVTESGVESSIANDANEALAQLKSLLSPDALVLIITSGEIGGLTQSVPEMIEKEF